MKWYDSWSETIDAVNKKVRLSDAQTHAYMTSIDDINSLWSDHEWYKTDLNPIKPV